MWTVKTVILAEVNMAVWSTLLRSSGRNIALLKSINTPIATKLTQNVIVRQMGGHGPESFVIKPSRYQWNKFKDLLHFFVMAGVIPASAIVFYVNVFVGPAKLTTIPEGYVPKHWEYHRHPISRFLSRYLYPSPQQDYEKYLHFIAEEKERIMLRQIENDVKDKMALRRDYQSYFYKPAIGKYHRISKEANEKMEDLQGRS